MNEQNNTTPLTKSLLFSALILSILVGGIAGGTAGFLVSSGGIEKVLQGNFFGDTGKSTQPSVPGVSTVTVVEDSETIRVVEAVNPSVVSIVATKDFGTYYNSDPFSDIFGFQFPGTEAPQGKQEVSAGTGFIVTADGLIMTNRHVVSEEGVEYTVVMNDQKKYDAKVVAVDAAFDVALLKIEASELPVVQLGDSENVKIGQTVIAIGNVLGQYQNSVTKGVLSGTGRTVDIGDEVLSDVFQTDTPINRGNSGGPLLDLSGQVIGINTAVDRRGESIGFVIPIHFAKSALESYEKTGKIIRPVLGIRYELVTKTIAEANKLPVSYGALVRRGENPEELAVIPGSPADKGGIVENDIILEIDGVKVDSQNPLAHLIQKHQVGETVKIKLSHAGQEKEITVTLEERK